MTNLTEYLLARGAPDAPAILAGTITITYADLRERVEIVARSLLAGGAVAQDRIAILAENGIFSIVAYLAVIRAGLVAVPLPTDLTPEVASGILARSGAVGLLLSARHETRARRWVVPEGTRILRESEQSAWRAGADAPLPATGDPEALAALMFTSGSTGAPKGVMVSSRNIEANTEDVVGYLGLQPDDRVLLVLPLFYCFGLSVLHTHLRVGGSLVINNEFTYPETVVRDLADRACTGFAGVPSTYQVLLRRTRFTRCRFPALRWLQQAGGHLPNPYIREVTGAFPQVKFFVMYGQTEATARLSYLPPERLGDKLGSIGRGLPSTRLEVLRPDGTAVEPGSEVGEIVATGENITGGYWDDPEETLKYFRNGRLHTGDLARIDEEGFVYVVERQRDVIKSGGNRVGATEVEDSLAELEDLAEVAVVGVPHDLLGEAIVAFVTTVPGRSVDMRAVMGQCRRTLPSAKVPEAIAHVARMPKGASGKPLKAMLRIAAQDILQDPDGPRMQAEGNALGVLAVEKRGTASEASAAPLEAATPQRRV